MDESGVVCMFCGGDNAHKVCRSCNKGYHIACARERGQLEIHEKRRGFVSSNVASYHWECPNCGSSASGKM